MKIPPESPIYKKDDNEIYEMGYDIPAHGGITYTDDNLTVCPLNDTDWFIGWDYAHYNDYLGYEEMYPKEIQIQDKKWTTKEIQEEVFNVCKYLKENIK